VEETFLSSCVPIPARKNVVVSTKKITKGLLVSIASAGMEIQVHGQTSCPPGRLAWVDHSIYSIPVTYAKLERKSQHSCHVSAEKSSASLEKV